MKNHYHNYTTQQIQKNKEMISKQLYEWAETFDSEVDENGEKSLENYDFVFDLAERLEKNICDEKDYDDINFHIWQINYNEEKIKIA